MTLAAGERSTRNGTFEEDPADSFLAPFKNEIGFLSINSFSTVQNCQKAPNTSVSHEYCRFSKMNAERQGFLKFPGALSFDLVRIP
jgi:hypothetical protein